MGNWDGPVLQYGLKNKVRYNHPLNLYNNDNKILLTSDYSNDNNFEIHSNNNITLIKRLKSK